MHKYKDKKQSSILRCQCSFAILQCFLNITGSHEGAGGWPPPLGLPRALFSLSTFLRTFLDSKPYSYEGAGGTAPSAGTAESSREQEKEDRRARLGLSSASSSSRPEAASSSYEQSKNATGSPAPTPLQPSAGSGGEWASYILLNITPTVLPGIGSMPSSQYLSKQALVLKFGARGSQPGFFTWPRGASNDLKSWPQRWTCVVSGIAVGPDNTVVVADSSNHRVQIFDEHGQNRWDESDGNLEKKTFLVQVLVGRLRQWGGRVWLPGRSGSQQDRTVHHSR